MRRASQGSRIENKNWLPKQGLQGTFLSSVAVNSGLYTLSGQEEIKKDPISVKMCEEQTQFSGT